MNIRLYRPEDKPRLEELHRLQNFLYPMPDLADPAFFIKLVGEQDGRIVNAGIAHHTAEIFFLADPNAGTPRERYENFLMLHNVGCDAARLGGLDELHCWVPPQVEKSFGRRLMRLGWKRPLWTDYAKDL